MFDFISAAYADEVAQVAATEPSVVSQFVPLVLIFIVFYFLLIRPQKKKMLESQKMLSELKTGDKVALNSGIIGVINQISIESNEVIVEIAPSVSITVRKDSILEVLGDAEHKPKVTKSVKTSTVATKKKADKSKK